MKKLLAALLLIPSLAFAVDYMTFSQVFTNTYPDDDHKDFSWSFNGYSDTKLNVAFLYSYSTVNFRLSWPKDGTVYLDVTDGVAVTTNYTATILTTNFPPDGQYYAEFAGVQGGIKRVFAAGRVMVQHSIYQNTDQSSWTNPAASTTIGPTLHTISTPYSAWPFASSVTVNETNGASSGSLAAGVLTINVRTNAADAGAGDITGVTAGTWITGGATSGDAPVAVDTNAVMAAVTGKNYLTAESDTAAIAALGVHTNRSLATSGHGPELDPVWAAASNNVPFKSAYNVYSTSNRFAAGLSSAELVNGTAAGVFSDGVARSVTLANASNAIEAIGSTSLDGGLITTDGNGNLSAGAAGTTNAITPTGLYDLSDVIANANNALQSEADTLDTVTGRGQTTPRAMGFTSDTTADSMIYHTQTDEILGAVAGPANLLSGGAYWLLYGASHALGPRFALNGNGGPVEIMSQTTMIEGNGVPWTNAGPIYAESYAGDGRAITNMTATQLTSGTVPLAALANIDETDLDASVNASLDLADSAVQPNDPLTDLNSSAAWRMFYGNGSSDVTELAFGDSGKVLTSGGASAAPTWETPSAGGVSFPLDYNGSHATNILYHSWDTNATAIAGVAGHMVQYVKDGRLYYVFNSVTNYLVLD